MSWRYRRPERQDWKKIGQIQPKPSGRRYQLCPTCGHSWIVRIRKNRAYIRGLRIYWPLVRGPHGERWARCPDQYHEENRSTIVSVEPDPPTTINLHAKPKEQRSTQKARAKAHRVSQSKERR